MLLAIYRGKKGRGTFHVIRSKRSLGRCGGDRDNARDEHPEVKLGRRRRDDKRGTMRRLQRVVNRHELARDQIDKHVSESDPGPVARDMESPKSACPHHDTGRNPVTIPGGPS